jgi:hypothetical protein
MKSQARPSYFQVWAHAVLEPRETQDVTVTVEPAVDDVVTLAIDVEDGLRVELTRGAAAYLAGALASEAGVRFG